MVMFMVYMTWYDFGGFKIGFMEWMPLAKRREKVYSCQSNDVVSFLLHGSRECYVHVLSQKGKGDLFFFIMQV